MPPIILHSNWNQRPSDFEKTVEPLRKYFFICGNYIAETQIQIEEFEEVSPLDNTLFGKIGKKKMRRRFSRLYYPEYTKDALHFGFLFDYIQPHWCGAHWRLIHIYPNR